jgi:hypothetical protein
MVAVSGTSEAKHFPAPKLESRADQEHDELQLRRGHVHSGVEVESTAGKHALFPGESVTLQKLLADDQAIVEVKMDQLTGGVIEREVILDPHVGTGRYRDHALVAGLRQHSSDAKRRLPVYQEVEVGVALDGRLEVLVAFPVAVGHAGFVEAAGQLRDDCKRSGRPGRGGLKLQGRHG